MKKSFKSLVSKLDLLTEDQEGKLKGGFSSAFQLSTKQSSALGNNCKCTNTDSHCGATGNNCKCNNDKEIL